MSARMIVAAWLALCGGLARAAQVESDLFPARHVRDAFMARGEDPRAIALGGAFTALATDAAAASWNPAGLADAGSPSALASYDVVGEGGAISHVGGALPFGPGAAAVAVTLASYGSVERFDAAGQPAGHASPTDVGVIAAYGLGLPPALGVGESIGFGLEWVQESSGLANVGFSAGERLVISDALIAGFAVEHMGSIKATGSLPAVVRIGAAYRWEHRLRLSFDAGMPLVDRLVYGAGGVEWAPWSRLAIRVGYRAQRDQGLRGLTGLTAGFGFRYGQFGVDYAYVPFGDLVTSHRMALVWVAARPPSSAELPAAQAEPPVTPAPAPVAIPEAVPAGIAAPVTKTEVASPPVTISPTASPDHRQVEMEFTVPASTTLSR